MFANVAYQLCKTTRHYFIKHERSFDEAVEELELATSTPQLNPTKIFYKCQQYQVLLNDIRHIRKPPTQARQ